MLMKGGWGLPAKLLAGAPCSGDRNGWHSDSPYRRPFPHLQRVGSKGAAGEVARALVAGLSPSLISPELLQAAMRQAGESQEGESAGISLGCCAQGLPELPVAPKQFSLMHLSS